MSDVVIRDLNGMAEFRLAEELQNAVWGRDDTADPADLMMVIQHEGGLVAGAFQDGRLIGYIFGFPTRDLAIQHSHRLAVLPEARGLGLGLRLKRYQRDWCLARGISHVRWTFDPLRAINAHLNIGRLGAIVSTYHVDYYGAMEGINQGTPSDRLLADWFLLSPGAKALAEGLPAPAAPTSLRLPIPRNFAALLDTDRDAALAHRLRVREVMLKALSEGLVVTGFDPGEPAYLFSKTQSARKRPYFSESQRRTADTSMGSGWALSPAKASKSAR